MRTYAKVGIRNLVCEDCGGLFEAKRTDIRRCRACAGKHRLAYQRMHDRVRRSREVCPKCGQRKSSPSVAQCWNCRVQEMQGVGNPNWQGGTTRHSAGYLFVLDPRPNPKHRYVAEHRLLWEQAYGPIPPGHIVHHLNGNKTDNRLENLTTLSNSAHRKLHADVDGERSRYIQRLEARIRELEALVNALPASPAQGGHTPRKVS